MAKIKYVEDIETHQTAGWMSVEHGPPPDSACIVKARFHGQDEEFLVAIWDREDLVVALEILEKKRSLREYETAKNTSGWILNTLRWEWSKRENGDIEVNTVVMSTRSRIKLLKEDLDRKDYLYTTIAEESVRLMLDVPTGSTLARLGVLNEG